MQLSRVRLQNFRNISFVDLSFEGGTQFFSGSNAQGKTNLLEGVGLISALRSFRTHDINTLIMQGCREAQLMYNIEDQGMGPTEVAVVVKKKGKEIQVDGEKVTRFRDYIGSFPTVFLSSQDIQLLRGSPGVRRQWLNLVLASSNHAYYDVLKDYHRLLLERNSLLKKPGTENEMEAFEAVLAEKALHLFHSRMLEIPRLEKHLQAAYLQISPKDEDPKLKFLPDCHVDSKEAFTAFLKKHREKDMLFKSTQHGPHRDDFELSLQGRKAKEFGSEGQQRSLMIALKIAQLRFLEETSGRTPVLLADDVLGELDQERKANFWRAIGDSVQVLATGTEVPRDTVRSNWQVFDVMDGAFTQRS